MKIGFLLSDLNAGGAERAASSLANYFSLHGHDVEIITFKDIDSFYPLNDEVRHLRLGFDEIALSLSLKRIFGALKRMFKIRSFVKARKLDVLIGMSFSMTWYTVFATKFTKTKSIGTERNNPYKYKATKINSFLRKFFYKFCDGYIFQTKKASLFFTDKLKGRDDIDKKRIFVTHTKCDKEIVEDVISAVKEIMPDFEEVIETTAGCTVTTHCGPNTLGILYVRK